MPTGTTDSTSTSTKTTTTLEGSGIVAVNDYSQKMVK